MLNLIASSQIDTSKITLTIPVARKVAVELIQGDSIKCELELTQNILQLTEKKVCIYDSIVIAYKQKEILYKEQLSADKSKEVEYKKYVDKLKKDNTKLSRKVKVLGVGLAATIVSIVTLILAK
jgi:hypothetical protein